jgi:hypothetical protein
LRSSGTDDFEANCGRRQPKPPLRVHDIEAIVAESGVDVSAETSRSLWDGSRMDLDMAVGGLMTLNGWR